MVSAVRNWLKHFWRTSSTSVKPAPVRLFLESLEERDCPAVFNIAAGDVAGLVAAITTSNTNNQADTINLAANATYSITAPNNTSVGDGTNGLPIVALDTAIVNSLTINGNGAIIQRSTAVGTVDFRILRVNGVLVLDSIAIANGNASDGVFGGGISVGAGGRLTVLNSAIINNTHTAQPGGGIGIEGGAGPVNIVNSTISGNRTTAAAGNGNGAGIETLNATGLLTILQSTVANNVATGAGSSGGGMRVAGTSTVEIRNSILFGNSDSSGNNDVSNGNLTAGDVTAATSIIRVATGTAITGAFSSADPLLGVLQNNGGRTVTHALQTGSSAINTGNNALAPSSTDQRGTGFNRIIGSTIDIGAYEFQPVAVLITLSSNVNPSTFGQAVTFTANVAGTAANSNIPQGTVSFVVDGSTVATIGLTNGTASVSISTLSEGTHSVVATFTPTATGDYTFAAGSSNTVSQRVNAATPAPTTTTTLTSAAAPVSRRWRR